MTIIQCLLVRKGGSHVELGDDVYHFTPNDNGDHVCAVEHDAHISTLLAIPEAYRLYRETETVKTVDLVKQQAGEIDSVVVTEEPTAPVTTDQPDATDEKSELETLRAQYAERFGKKPHHMMGIAKLRDALGVDEE